MKKTLTILGIIILSLLITFLEADTFSLYHFGDILTFTTYTYLLFIFSILIYIFSTIFYIIQKKLKKEKIALKKLISIILVFISLILILSFIIILNYDWLTYYSSYTSFPFYVFILTRSLEFLLPAVILIIISVILLFKKNKQ